MKKILLFVFSLLLINLTSVAATGWFEDYVIVNPNNSGSGHYWIGANPGFGTQLQGHNFGIVSSLVITGADMKYWSDTKDRTGGAFYYLIKSADGNTIHVPATEVIWTQSGPDGNNYQGLWTGTINLISTLSPSTSYQLHIYAKHWGTGQGDNWLSNGGANYIATFTTVAAPVAYNVTGTGSYCFGNAGLAVGLDDSETGVTYTLYKGGVAQTPTINGTGEAITFGVQTVGTYTVKGTRSVFTTDMTGSAIITENPTSVGGTISGGTNVCSGTNSTLLTLSGNVGNVIKWQFSTNGGTNWTDIANTETTYTATDLTVTTQYQAIVKSGECATATSSVAIITVYSGIPTSVSASASPNPICAGATLTLNGNATSATSWSWTGPNSFSSTLQNPTILNITTASSGVYSLIASNVCGSAVAVSTSSVTVNSLPAAAGPITGNTTVSALTNGVSYSIDPISGASSYVWTYTDVNVIINGSGSSVTLNFGLYATSGVLKVKGQNDCGSGTESTLSISVTPTITAWTGAVNSDWDNPGNWYPGVPAATTAVVINSSLVTPYPNITTPVSCASIVLKSGASILGNELLTVSGTSKVERLITGNKWHFISPPVGGLTANSFLDFFLQTWSEPDAEWTYITDENTPLVAATGYSLFLDAGDNTYSFTGSLNSGTKFIGITESGTSTVYNGANLVGNPYPSYLDWDGLRSTYGAIQYWDGTGYKSWNGTGAGTRYAAPCQGFFIIKDATFTATQFTVTEANRTNMLGTWYKSAEELRPSTLVLETSGNNYTDKLFVEFNNQAAETFELVNDAYKLVSTTEGISQLYSYTGEKKLSIDVRPSCEVIQLGFTNTLSGQYQIGISEMNSISKATLEDTKTATFHALLNGPYSFSYTAGDDDKRFKLRMGSVGIDKPTAETCKIYSYDKTAVINLPSQTKGDIYIYNLAGQLISLKESATGEIRIGMNTTGVYMVKVVTKMETINQKIWIR